MHSGGGHRFAERRPLVLLVAALVTLSAWLLPARASASTYVHITIQGVINPIKAHYVARAIDVARREHADLILVSIDTPGGLVSSMQEITSAFVNSGIPVVGYVEPRSAQATSAGAFILLSTDVAAMAPDTRVGAAHPVSNGKPLEGAMDAKATNSLVSLSRSLAARRGRPEAFAIAIVRDSSSYTAREAKEQGAVEILAPTRDDLFAQLEGRTLAYDGHEVTLHPRGATAIEMPLSWSERLLDDLADPTLASLLLSIGLLAILYEFSSPGIGMGGIVGTIAVLAGLLGMSVLPFEVGGVLLMGVGIVGMGLEVKVPSHGLLALAGIVALALGALFVIDTGSYFGAVQRTDLRVFAPLVLVFSALVLLAATKAAKALRAPQQTGTEAMVGHQGTAKTRVDSDGGQVFVDGARWSALAEPAIEAGARVAIVEVLTHPTRLRVKPCLETREKVEGS